MYRIQSVTLSRALVISLLLSFLFIPHSVLAGSWARWTKRAEPIFSGEYMASDPSIIKDGSRYRMFYTCLTGLKFDLWHLLTDPAADARTALCQATSQDGFSWEHVSEEDGIKGLALKGEEGKWDEHIEGAYAIKTSAGDLLYFSGYRTKGTPQKGFPAALSVARSEDGRTFTRVAQTPILSPTPGWYDNDAIYSPVIVREGDEFVMIYVAHCYTKCDNGPAVVLVAATSKDGLAWEKKPKPIFRPSSDIPWTQDGVAEPGVVKGPDGFYYLFFTGLKGEERVIGVGRSNSLFGSWYINPTPILTKSSTEGAFDEVNVLAPYVLIEGDKVRMWYLGSNKEELIRIGYAEAVWPLYTDD